MDLFQWLFVFLPFVAFFFLVAKAAGVAPGESAPRANSPITPRPSFGSRVPNDEEAILHRRLRNMLLGDDNAVARLVQYELSTGGCRTRTAAYERAIGRIHVDNVRFD